METGAVSTHFDAICTHHKKRKRNYTFCCQLRISNFSVNKEKQYTRETSKKYYRMILETIFVYLENCMK